MVPSIGFIGFGEAGSTIANGLRSAGADRLQAFDINRDSPRLGPRMRQRAAESQTLLVSSSEELARSSDVAVLDGDVERRPGSAAADVAVSDGPPFLRRPEFGLARAQAARSPRSSMPPALDSSRSPSWRRLLLTVIVCRCSSAADPPAHSPT